MKADFTRSTFKPEKNFSGVRMQQGRVQLDSDWNEQLDIQARLDRVTERDVIGPCGLPLEGGGFQIDLAPANDLSISPGRFYADGILVEFLPEPVPFIMVKTDKTNPQVKVGIWTPDSRDFTVGQLVMAYDAAAPAGPLLLTINAADSINRTLTLAAALPGTADLGALLSGFAMPRLVRNATYNTQPYYSDPSAATRTAGTYLAYLDVWERLRTPLEEPVTREVALGGTDTAARSQLVWQVKLWPLRKILNPPSPTGPAPAGGSGGPRGNISGRPGVFGRPSVFSTFAAGTATAVARQPVVPAASLAGRPIEESAANVGSVIGSMVGAGAAAGSTAPAPPAGGAAAPSAAAPGTTPVPPSCLGVLNSTDWANFVARPKAWMSAQSTPQPTSTDPCIVPPRAGYRRLENQLYRVEVHAGSSTGTPSFKWSRENGSVVTAWNVSQSAPNALSVASLGRDSVLGFAAGQWVELTDDNFELQQTNGILAKLSDAKIGPDGPVLVLDPATPTVDFTQFTLNPKIRRWDQADATQIRNTGDILVQEGTWINLEGGVQIKFQPGGVYTTGDYWIVPARTITGDVEWSIDDTGTAIPQPPAGVVHHYCHLALLEFSGSTWTFLDDCRQPFPPAAALGIHVSKTNWSNDDTFPMDVILSQGLQITLDAPPDPTSVSLSSVIVELERPVGDTIGEFRIVLAGSATLQGNVITWKSGGSDAFKGLLAGTTQQVRLRVTLKGRWIWGIFGDDTYYVDGQAFGNPDFRSDRTTPRVALSFPSGSGEIASDFESWLWLVPPAQTKVASLTVNPTAVMTQGGSQGTVTLSAAPPTGGASVTLVSSNTAIAVVPPSVFVPAGSTSATFNIQAGASFGPVTITASLGGTSSAATLTVIGLQSLALVPDIVSPGETAIGTVTFTAAIPTGLRVAVALGANPPVVQLVPSPLVITPGTNSGSFRINVQGAGTKLLLAGAALPAAGAPAAAAGPAVVGAPAVVGRPGVIGTVISRGITISASFGGVTVRATLTISLFV
jgi:Family of unknown function (DUF6519)